MRSTTLRQLGTRSILVTTTVTFGQASMTFLSSVISADVSSPVASETSSTASACISVANVLAVCADRVSPTPGVSIRTRPLSSSARGMPISARTTCCAAACFVTWSIGTAMRSVGVWKIDPPADALRTSAADGVSACWTKVGTVVVMSSPTAQTGALSNALTSWLLPCLDSPTTRTRNFGSSCCARFSRSRASRSGLRCVTQAPIVSSSTSSQGGAIT